MENFISEFANQQIQGNESRLYGFNKLTDTDRANLCDIAWYLRGLKAAGTSPFTDQEESLEKAILAISDKVRFDKKIGYDKS